MAINEKQIYEIVKIVATAVISIAATLFVQSCTASISIQKNTHDSSQETKSSTESSVDSTYVNFQPIKNN